MTGVGCATTEALRVETAADAVEAATATDRTVVATADTRMLDT